jgi:CHAT domain-containing protein
VLAEINKYDKDFPPEAKAINAENIFEISRTLNRTIVIFRILRRSSAIIFVFPSGEIHIKEVEGVGQKEVAERFLYDWLIPYQQWKFGEIKLEEWKDKIEQLLESIYEKLLIHVHQILKEKPAGKEVLFVPNQSLALWPLHAASWTAADGKKHYLIEEYAISYAPSVSVFKRCLENEKGRSSGSLLVSNPTGDLYFSEQEIAYIERLQHDGRKLCGKDATKAVVLGALREDYGFAHFSCHGFYSEANPFDSGLVMSDEVINLSEIINCPLQSNWLTTLSACETGMVDFYSPTDEHFGLPLGFIFAGSPTVWASLWAVSDLETSHLMQKAYENLNRDEYQHNKLEALRQAQLSMLEEFPHPFYWAGFQHFGV